MRTVYFLFSVALLMALAIPALAQTKTADIDLPVKVKKLEAENEAIKKELAKLKQELADLKAQLAPPNVDSMDTVYKAMKLTTMKIVGGPFKPGDQVKVQYGLKNHLQHAVRLPVDKKGVAGVLGVRQHWIERLGKDAAIPAIPAQIARAGRRYAAGGDTIYSVNMIKPGQIVPFERTIATKGFPPGTYRYYVVYEDSKGKVLQTESVEFELVGK